MKGKPVIHFLPCLLLSISNISAVPFIPFTSRFCFERGKDMGTTTDSI
jgi:hypothetical protein